MILTKEILGLLMESEFVPVKSIIEQFGDERIQKRLAILIENGNVDQNTLVFFITKRGTRVFNQLLSK
jgi:hypothetical protein